MPPRSPDTVDWVLVYICSHLPEEIGLFQWKVSGDTLKNSKTTRDAYLCLHLSIHIKISQSNW
jgi:hypothetical protein